MNRIMTHVHLPEEVTNDFHQFSKFTMAEKLVRPLRDVGVNIFHLDMGGDWVARVLNTASENYFWNAMNGVDLILSELEQGQSKDSNWMLVKNIADLDTVTNTEVSGIILCLGGGRPLEGKANLNLLSNLRHFHRFGVRVVQLSGYGRNRSADGVAEQRTHGKLSYFGCAVVEEMLRLNMLIDTSAINDEGFAHIVELLGDKKLPLINSRANCKALSDHPLNLSDTRIKQLVATGGVMGLSFYADLVALSNNSPTIDDLVAHIKHLSDLVGVEHIAIGGDISAIDSPTPTRYERHPGLVNGLAFKERTNDYVEGCDKLTAIELIAEKLLQSNYKEDDIQAILGGNMLRIYRQVLA